MERREEKSLLVLCGHSHNRVEFLAAPNLRVLVGGAEAEVADLKDSIYIHDGQAPHTEALNHIDDRLKQEEILNFWFGESCDVDYSQKSHQLWFGKNVEIDALLKERYFSLYELACEGKLSHWSVEPKGRMALILLLDQFSRNLFRESSQAFAQDSEALFLTLSGIDLGHDRLLSPIQRSFFYLPLEHSEDPKMQELSVQKMVELLSEVPWEYRNKYQSFVDYARRHKVIIDRFGRYPHRNKVLGRESTQDEIEFLKKEGSIF
ncbi:MAG: hypothetical protein CMO81_01960 [Waddliaceae bacterium]|nr:hypothetical protein [Waddliaceae bacterium]